MAAKYSTVCITKNIVFIKENIASVDRILDLLLEDDVIQMTEREDIVAKIPGERVHTMIDLILKRRAQQIFIDALKKTGQNLIVEQILATQKEVTDYREPKPHTISLLSPKIATYAPFHRERSTMWQQKDNMHHDRRSHDDVYKRHIDKLLETKRQNEAKIHQLENEMDKIRKSEKKKYKQLEKEHKELIKENSELKAKADELKNKLQTRDEMLKMTTNKTNAGQDEVDSPLTNNSAFIDMKKSQENFENKLMREMAKGQQQLLQVVQKLSQDNKQQEKKIAEATAKLDQATAKLDAVANKIESKMETNDNRKATGKSSSTLHDAMFPPVNQAKLGKTISSAMARREESFIYDVGVPSKK